MDDPLPLAIRPADAGDAPRISALIRALAGYFLVDPANPDAAEGFFRTVSPEAVAGYLADGRHRYHLAEVAGGMAGVVGMRDDAHLLHLFVAEPFHRRGIARRLWARARDEARAAGNPGRFTVNSSLPARPLYESLGFVPTGDPVEKDGIRFVPMVRTEPPAS